MKKIRIRAIAKSIGLKRTGRKIYNTPIYRNKMHSGAMIQIDRDIYNFMRETEGQESARKHLFEVLAIRY